MTKGRFQRVVFQPHSYEGMQKGINQIVDAVSPTLGPHPRTVVIDQITPGKVPEVLDNGGIIARRIIELSNRDADMGAMFVRQVLWRVHEQVGDGTATTAVMFRTVYNEGVRYMVSGGNAMLLRRYLDEGLRVILDGIDGMTVSLSGKEQLAQLAESICHDPSLARYLGEIFDIIGEHGQLDVRSGRGREMERQYVEGMYWDGGVLSRSMITDRTELKTTLRNAAILITDLDLEDPHALIPVLEMTKQADLAGLLIVATKISDNVTAVLLSASREPEEFQVIAAKLPGMTRPDQSGTMEDLTALVGGRPIVGSAGDSLASVKLEDLGRARRAWADRYHFGIIGGKGDARMLRAHVANLRAAFGNVQDAETRKKLQKRIGKLLGGSATLWVGGSTELEIKMRKELAERTADALRGAVREGVVPGGGMSLLACRPALKRCLEQSSDGDERAAYRILIEAMEAPTRTLLTNAGYDASEVMAEIRLAGNGAGFDVRSGKVVNMAQSGIWDPAAVLKTALHGAVASAALALTTDVLIHHKKRDPVMQP